MLYNGCNYLCMLWLKLIHVSKRGPWWVQDVKMSIVGIYLGECWLCYDDTALYHTGLILDSKLIMWCPCGLTLTHCGVETAYGHRFESTLAQVMACCLMAPSHYLNQCCRFINWTLTTNFSETLISVLTFSLKKMRLKMSAAKWWPFCPGPQCVNVLNIIVKEWCECGKKSLT